MPAMRPPLCAWTVHAEPMDPLFSLRFNTPITHRLLRDLSSQPRVSFFPSPLIHAFLRKCTRVHRRSCSAQVKLLTLSLLARCSCDLFFSLYIVQPLLFRLAFFFFFLCFHGVGEVHASAGKPTLRSACIFVGPQLLVFCSSSGSRLHGLLVVPSSNALEYF